MYFFDISCILLLIFSLFLIFLIESLNLSMLLFDKNAFLSPFICMFGVYTVDVDNILYYIKS